MKSQGWASETQSSAEAVKPLGSSRLPAVIPMPVDPGPSPLVRREPHSGQKLRRCVCGPICSLSVAKARGVPCVNVNVAATGEGRFNHEGAGK